MSQSSRVPPQTSAKSSQPTERQRSPRSPSAKAAKEGPAPGAAQVALGSAPPPAQGAAKALVVQRKGAGKSQPTRAVIMEAASEGLRGPSEPLPYFDKIQASFGHHDVTDVKAHRGSQVTAAAQKMWAKAFTRGSHVGFAAPPSLHTTAHEAAHVVQQRGDVQLLGGVDRAGDPYERHADAVADRVVRGESAEALLDQHAPANRGGAGAQHKDAVQRLRVTSQDEGNMPFGPGVKAWFLRHHLEANDSYETRSLTPPARAELLELIYQNQYALEDPKKHDRLIKALGGDWFPNRQPFQDPHDEKTNQHDDDASNQDHHQNSQNQNAQNQNANQNNPNIENQVNNANPQEQQPADQTDAAVTQVLTDNELTLEQKQEIIKDETKKDPKFLERLIEKDYDKGVALIDSILKSDRQGVKSYKHVGRIATKAAGLLTAGMGRRFGRWVGGALTREAFAVHALRQVFGITLEATDWSNDALHHMYFMLRHVPRSHANGVKKINRSATFNISSSAGIRDINMARLPTSISMRWVPRSTQLKFLMKKSVYSQRMRSKNAFKMTALHEIGHIVDTKFNIMNKVGIEKENDDNYGAWKHHNAGLSWMAEDMAPYLTYSNAEQPVLDYSYEETSHGLTKRQIKALGTAILLGQGVQRWVRDWATQILNDESAAKEKGAVWLAERKATLTERASHHPIVPMCKAGTKFAPWTLGRGELAQLAGPFGGRMFHQAYSSSDWVSYKVAAKDIGVSHYQFRAPQEWFAELYAHYYMGTLQGHPLRGWLDEVLDDKRAQSGDPPKQPSPQDNPQQQTATVVDNSTALMSLESTGPSSQVDLGTLAQLQANFAPQNGAHEDANVDANANANANQDASDAPQLDLELIEMISQLERDKSTAL